MKTTIFILFFSIIFVGVNAQNGATLFKKCAACHSYEPGKNKVGPTLFAIMGRKVAYEPGYPYSIAMRGIAGFWNYNSLMNFLFDPKQSIPGNKMIFMGIKNEEDRKALVNYLATFK